MNISHRLKRIGDRVKYPSLADIGTDHAYLPIYLNSTGRITRAAACDINNGPLEKAAENIERFGLSDSIQVRLGSGLAPVGQGEFETLVMSGMGSLLITGLLSEQLETAKSFKQLILQPQRDIKALRLFLIGNGFGIIDEEILLDGGKYYFIIEAQVSQEKIQPYSETEITFGRQLLAEKNALLKRFISDEQIKCRRVLSNFDKSETYRSYLVLCDEALEDL